MPISKAAINFAELLVNQRGNGNAELVLPACRLLGDAERQVVVGGLAEMFDLFGRKAVRRYVAQQKRIAAKAVAASNLARFKSEDNAARKRLGLGGR